MTRPQISFELFPPKTEAARASFWPAVEALAALEPVMMTVTYGANGSTRDATIETAMEVHRRTGIATAAHLTAVGTTKTALPEMAETLWTGGVRHIVALRGDMPKDAGALEAMEENENFHSAGELVTALKKIHPFSISVGCYPEKHPEAASAQGDLDALRAKFDAGADQAITQFFFGAETYFDFLSRVRAAGLDQPIIPGLLPIASFERMSSFAAACRANVPDWLKARFDGLADGSPEAKRVSVAVLAEHIRALAEGGAEQLHFYTLNRADLVADALAAA